MSALDEKALAAALSAAYNRQTFEGAIKDAITAYLSAASPKGQVEAVAVRIDELLAERGKTKNTHLWQDIDEDLLREIFDNWPTIRTALGSPAPAGGWQEHYDRPEHLALDLRQIAENFDERTGYATTDAQIIRRAATCFDRLPEATSSNKARAVLAARSKAEGR